MDFRGRQAIFFITLLCCVVNSEPIPLNLTRLPTPGPAPLNLTRLGIPGPVTLNLTGLPIPEPTPLNLTKVLIPMAPPTGYHVSYFLLALQWPGAYDNKCNSRQAFLIHGLWPKPGLPRGSHTDELLKLPKGGQFIKEMKSMWPSITKKCDNRAFWQHEWQYHGNLSNLPSQQDYFSKTVALARQVNLLDALKRKHIFPSPSKLYAATDFANALRRDFPEFGKIVCSRDRPNELSEIRLCVDSRASEYIKCPRRYNTNPSCGPLVKFPPFNSRQG